MEKVQKATTYKTKQVNTGDLEGSPAEQNLTRNVNQKQFVYVFNTKL